MKLLRQILCIPLGIVINILAAVIALQILGGER
jgi:hypothetical protein